jgi:hypothetical protein
MNPGAVRARPSELIHIDVTKLGRIGSIGHRITRRRASGINRHLGFCWEFLHVSIDDASRVLFSQVMKDERKRAPSPFSRRRLPTI